MLHDIHGMLHDVHGMLHDVHGMLHDVHGMLRDVHGMLHDVHGMSHDVHGMSQGFTEKLQKSICLVLKVNSCDSLVLSNIEGEIAGKSIICKRKVGSRDNIKH